MEHTDRQVPEDRPAPASSLSRDILAAAATSMAGQKTLAERLLVALLAGGHVLLEGVPGLGMTLLVRALAEAMQAEFSRFHFTPDLLPDDLAVTQMYDRETGTFQMARGPFSANLVLAGDINRAPGGVQDALVEAIQERRLEIDGRAYAMPDLFFLVATRNPLRQRGTHPLITALRDRFMFSLAVDPPGADAKWLILDSMTGAPLPPTEPVVSPAQVLAVRQSVNRMHVDEHVKDYALDLILATREPNRHGMEDLQPLIRSGASTRADGHLIQAARAHAAIRGRSQVLCADVKAVAPDVLRHRVIVSRRARVENLSSADIVQQILDRAPMP